MENILYLLFIFSLYGGILTELQSELLLNYCELLGRRVNYFRGV